MCASEGQDQTKRRKKENMHVENRGIAICGGNGSPSIMTHTNSTSSCLYGLLFLFMVGGLLLLFMETMIALLLQGFGSDYSGTLNEHL